jgi:hypothetical protein
VKISIAFQRASHVNSGTSIDPAELPWPETQGRVMRHPLLHLESDPRGEITHYGGLVLAQQFVRRFRVAQRLDESLVLFKRHAPYFESDHVLARTRRYCKGARRSGGWWGRVGYRTRARREIFCVGLGAHQRWSS